MKTKPVVDRDEPSEIDAPAKPTGNLANPSRRIGTWFLHELREVLSPTIFCFVGFNLIVLTTNLILADYAVAFASFMLATAAALVVGNRCWWPTRWQCCGATIAGH